MKRTVLSGVIAGWLVLGAQTASASPILNGGFEDAGFTGWQVDTADVGSLLIEGGRGHSGATSIWFGAVGVLSDRLWQTFDTTPGQSYTLTFWLSHAASYGPNDFTVIWDGIPILDLTNVGRFDYREYTFITTAQTALSTIEFAGRDMLGYFRLDDVSIAEASTPEASTPEPATLLLLGAGIAGLARRRSRYTHTDPH